MELAYINTIEEPRVLKGVTKEEMIKTPGIYIPVPKVAFVDGEISPSRRDNPDFRVAIRAYRIINFGLVGHHDNMGIPAIVLLQIPNKTIVKFDKDAWNVQLFIKTEEKLGLNLVGNI